MKVSPNTKRDSIRLVFTFMGKVSKMGGSFTVSREKALAWSGGGKNDWKEEGAERGEIDRGGREEGGEFYEKDLPSLARDEEKG